MIISGYLDTNFFSYQIFSKGVRDIMANEVLLTQEGYEKLEKELDYLVNVKRRQVAKRIKVAREFGDIGENSEYDDAKKRAGLH